MISLIGAIGAFLLAFCGLPEVISSLRKGYCGASWGLLVTWVSGEILTFVYILGTSADIYLLFNYGVNILLISILILLKRKPMRAETVKVLTDFRGLK